MKNAIKTLLNDIYLLAKNDSGDIESKLAMYQFCASSYWHNYSGTFVHSELENDLVTISENIIDIDLDNKFDENHILHVMTEAYDTGGHSRVVENWIKAAPQKHSIVVNNSFSQLPNFLIDAVELKDGKIILNTATGLVEKAKFLATTASQYKYIVLHHHPHDILPLLAFGTHKFSRPIFFYNHADHVWGCGYSVSDRIIELSQQGIQHSIKYRGIPNERSFLGSIPIALPDKSSWKFNKTKKSIITMASSYKFKPIDNLSFQNFIDKILSEEADTHYCVIGVSSSDNTWTELLVKYPQRIHLMGVLLKEEAHALIQECSLYLDSFPLGSGTSLIEALSLGIPVLSYASPIQHMDSYKQYSYGNLDELFHEAITILNYSNEERLNRAMEAWESLQKWHSLQSFLQRIEDLNEIKEHIPLILSKNIVNDSYINLYTDFMYQLLSQKNFKFDFGPSTALSYSQKKKITSTIGSSNFLDYTSSLSEKEDWFDAITNHSKSFFQLFLDVGGRYCEETSIKLPIMQNTEIQEFVFDLSDKANLIGIRLDPLNDSCVIEIESVRLIKEDREIDLAPFIHANDCTHHGKSYFFDHDDPQIYFEGINNQEFLGAQKLIVCIRYPHVAKDALYVCVKTELAQSKTELAQSKTELAQSKTELAQSKTELAQSKTELAQSKTELDQIKVSLSWRVTKPLRKIKHSFKGYSMKIEKIIALIKHVKRNPYLVKKFINETKNFGLKNALKKAKSKTNFGASAIASMKKPECTFNHSGKVHDIKVSVIIPTYNRSALLPSLLESWRAVDEVTKYKYEIIFSDDGSEDGSVEILENAKDLPIKVIKNNHGGAAKARNSAILQAQGEKLYIIGDDIFPNPQIINQHYEKLRTLPICKAVLGEIVWHKDLSVNTLMKHITELGNEQFSFNAFDPYRYVDFRHFYTSNISIDREFLLSEKIIFDESFYKVNFEDIELGYRLSKKDMEVYYYPDAKVEHYHPYTSVSGFCRRQQIAGEMALVFNKLHSDVEWVLQVEQILSQWNLNINSIRNIEIESLLDKVIELCQLLEDQKHIEKFNLENSISNIYRVLFRFYYEKGIVENSYTLENGVVGKIFTKYFLPLILKYIEQIKQFLSLDIIDEILHIKLTQQYVKLIIEVNSLEEVKKIKDSYKDFENDILIRLKSDAKNIDEVHYIYKVKNSIDLHPSNLRQIILFIQNNSNVDFVLLSFGLLDLPNIGISENLNNNIIMKNSGITLNDIGSKKYSGKLIRLISERYDKKMNVREVIKEIKIDDYGYWNKRSNTEQIESQISNFNTTLHRRSEKKVFFVFPIFLAVGGVERNTAEIINHLHNEYDFVIVNFERLNESLGSLHHQFIDSCIALYDLAELSSHDAILNYLKILENLYAPELVWICNGSPWLENNLGHIRTIFKNSAIVDQEAYDTEVGWVQLYKNKDKRLLTFDRFIAINSIIKDVFIKTAEISEDQIDLIYSVMSSEKRKLALMNSKDILYAKYNLKSTQKYFLFIGRLTEQKAPFDLLKLIKLIVSKYGYEYKFILVGSGELSDSVTAYIESNQLSDNIIRLPYIENTFEISMIASAIVFTSLYEGLSIALLEALSVGTPGISTDVGDTKLIFDKYNNGFTFKSIGNINEYFSTFEDFIKDYDFYKRNADANKQEIAKKFSPEHISSQYLECFETAIRQKKIFIR